MPDLYDFICTMDDETDPEQLEKQRKLWKLFGRETQAGKELFSLYNKA